jgi:hypothetical protein
MSLKDVMHALDGNIGPWSLRNSIRRGVWPPLKREPDNSISLREVYRRFEKPGAAVRKMAEESGDIWKFLSRPTLVSDLRDRIRDPAIMQQNPTGLCGPYAVIMEFARRDPVLYVQGAAELLRTGVFTARSGKKFIAAKDLRDSPLPSTVLMAETLKSGTVVRERPESADWIYAATIRDSENFMDDLDNAKGMQASTSPHEIKEWIQDMLGLKASYIPCLSEDELVAIRAGQRAIDRGGVAILEIDQNLLKHEPGNTEEQMWWSNRRHYPGGRVDNLSQPFHCKDDALPADHYVVMLGGLKGASSDAPEFRVRVWSWGTEYWMTGKPDSFGEYLYGVIIGEP